MKIPTIIQIAASRNALLQHTCLTIVLSTALIFNTYFTTAFANTALNPFIAEYIVENDYVTGGKATLSLKQNETKSYDFVLQTKPTGIFKLTGKGNIREHAVLPSLNAPFESTSYRYTDKGDSDRNYFIEFNRPDGEFQITRQAETLTHKLPGDSIDRLSVTLEILSHLKNTTEFTSLDVNIINGTEAQKIVFTNEGTEQVSSGIGEISALRISKAREASNRQTIIWLAEMENTEMIIPAKIEQYKRGKLTMRLILASFSTVE